MCNPSWRVQGLASCEGATFMKLVFNSLHLLNTDYTTKRQAQHVIAFIPANPDTRLIWWGVASPRLQMRGTGSAYYCTLLMVSQQPSPALPDSQAKIWEKESWTSLCLALLCLPWASPCPLWARFLTHTMRSPGCQLSHSWTYNPLTPILLKSTAPLFFFSFQLP